MMTRVLAALCAILSLGLTLLTELFAVTTGETWYFKFFHVLLMRLGEKSDAGSRGLVWIALNWILYLVLGGLGGGLLGHAIDKRSKGDAAVTRIVSVSCAALACVFTVLTEIFLVVLDQTGTTWFFKVFHLTLLPFLEGRDPMNPWGSAFVWPVLNWMLNIAIGALGGALVGHAIDKRIWRRIGRASGAVSPPSK